MNEIRECVKRGVVSIDEIGTVFSLFRGALSDYDRLDAECKERKRQCTEAVGVAAALREKHDSLLLSFNNLSQLISMPLPTTDVVETPVVEQTTPPPPVVATQPPPPLPPPAVVATPPPVTDTPPLSLPPSEQPVVEGAVKEAAVKANETNNNQPPPSIPTQSAIDNSQVPPITSPSVSN